jgi:hypothetical protein
MKDIYENWNLYKEEVELLQELENIFLEHSEEDMLNENVLAKVVEKVQDWFLKLSMKVIDLAKSAGKKALSLLSGAAGIVRKFAKKYPTLAKIVGMVIAVAAAYVVMSMIDPSVAQADVVFDGKLLSQEELDAFEGVMQNVDFGEYSQQEQLKLSANVRRMFNSPDVEQLNKSMDGVAGEVSAIVKKIRGLADESPEGKQYYEKLVKLGEDYSVRMRGTSVVPTQID